MKKALKIAGLILGVFIVIGLLAGSGKDKSSSVKESFKEGEEKAKDMLDEQRSLIRLVFADLKLDEGKLSYTYSKTFKILSEAVAATNGSNVDKMDGFENGKFEPSKKSDVTGQRGNLLPSRPIWLRG